MGFGEQLKDIIDRLPDCRQTLLFSATLPKMLVEFAKAGLTNPVLLRLDVESKLPDALDTTFLSVRTEDKPAALLSVMRTLPKKSQILVFAATKHHVEYLHMVSTLSVICDFHSMLSPIAFVSDVGQSQNIQHLHIFRFGSICKKN